MGPAKIEMGSVLFLTKCVGFEPFYKVGPVPVTIRFFTDILIISKSVYIH